MIVFLVGGESRLMDALITKMEKDGHKTYLLTGKRDGRGKYRRVFERYNFPYDSESVREIFTNVNPDLVIQQRYPRNGTGIVQKLSGNGDFAGRKYLQKLS